MPSLPSEVVMDTVEWRGRIQWKENGRHKGRGFTFVSKQAVLLSSPISSLSLCPSSPRSVSVALSPLFSHTEKSAGASVSSLSSKCSRLFRFSAKWYFSCLCCIFYLSSFSCFPLFLFLHHGEQITCWPRLDHGCLPLQRSQRSVSEPTCLYLNVSFRRTTWQILEL